MPQRIQRRRTRGWRMPEGAIYVGRSTVWGNPYDKAYAEARLIEDWRPFVVREYRRLVSTMPTFIALVRKRLHGKDLACWCPPGPCHADVLLEIANGGGKTRGQIVAGDGDGRHGTLNGYVNLRCRCEPCRDANTRWHCARRAARAAVSLSPNDPRHGRYTTYTNHGCRCNRCRAASTQRRRGYRAVLKAGGS